jgi:hypothetical protein
MASFAGACLGTAVALMLITFSEQEPRPLVCKTPQFAQDANH